MTLIWLYSYLSKLCHDGLNQEQLTFFKQRSLKCIITQCSGILDSDQPVATFQGMLFPDNNWLKLIKQGHPGTASYLDWFCLSCQKQFFFTEGLKLQSDKTF